MLNTRLLSAAAIGAFYLVLSTPVMADPASAEAHARAMNDIAATPSAGQGPDDGSDQGPAPEPYDPLQSRINVMMDMAQVQLHSETEFAKLRQDPRYQTYLHGGWEYYTDHADAGPGEYCAAAFWSKDGFIVLSGPGGDYQGAMIVFVGNDVPKPPKFKVIKATLAQTGASPVTLSAFNFPKDPDTPEMGRIGFAVPSADALMGGMEEKNDFVVSIKGEEIFSLGWRDGLAARDKWNQCLSLRSQ